MKFPEWAPPVLVEKYGRQMDKAAQLRAHARELRAEGWGELQGPPEDGEPTPELSPAGLEASAAGIEQEAAQLAQLLTREDMRAVWGALDRPLRVGLQLVGDFTSADIPWMLWDWIEQAVREFHHESRDARPPAVQRRELESVLTKAAALRDAIEQAPAVGQLAARVGAEHVGQQVFARLADERAIKLARWEAFSGCPSLALESELRHARRLVDEEEWAWLEAVDGEEPDDSDKPLPVQQWRDRPALAQILTIAEEGHGAGLVGLLDTFVSMLQTEVQRIGASVAQPGRGDDALRPLLIWRLHQFMQHFFGQPLDDVVAAITTCVLNLPEPLTRDDVRPLVRRRRDREQRAG